MKKGLGVPVGLSLGGELCTGERAFGEGKCSPRLEDCKEQEQDTSGATGILCLILGSGGVRMGRGREVSCKVPDCQATAGDSQVECCWDRQRTARWEGGRMGREHPS